MGLNRANRGRDLARSGCNADLNAVVDPLACVSIQDDQDYGNLDDAFRALCDGIRDNCPDGFSAMAHRYPGEGGAHVTGCRNIIAEINEREEESSNGARGSQD